MGKFLPLLSLNAETQPQKPQIRQKSSLWLIIIYAEHKDTTHTGYNSHAWACQHHYPATRVECVCVYGCVLRLFIHQLYLISAHTHTPAITLVPKNLHQQARIQLLKYTHTHTHIHVVSAGQPHPTSAAKKMTSWWCAPRMNNTWSPKPAVCAEKWGLALFPGWK